jgi:type III restriction enzyme
MRLFEDKEIISYLTNRLEMKKSVYDAVVYDSEIERKFAEELDRGKTSSSLSSCPAGSRWKRPSGNTITTGPS